MYILDHSTNSLYALADPNEISMPLLNPESINIEVEFGTNPVTRTIGITSSFSSLHLDGKPLIYKLDNSQQNWGNYTGHDCPLYKF